MSMYGNLDEVIAETERFLKKATDLRNTKLDGQLKYRAAKAEHDKKEGATEWNGPSAYYYDPSPKDTGAVRRASMDLTRALADLRRP